MKIVNDLENFCFSGDGNISQNGLKGFDRAKHIGLPHKHKSYE